MTLHQHRLQSSRRLIKLSNGRRLFRECLLAPRCRSAFPIFVQLGSFSSSSVDAFSASEEQVNEVNAFRPIFNRGLALGLVLSGHISKLGGRKRQKQKGKAATWCLSDRFTKFHRRTRDIVSIDDRGTDLYGT